MAAFVTHIVLADKVIHHFPNISKPDYFAGTIFPDIRHLNIISHDETHLTDFKINKSDSSFIVGMKVHALVDKQREDFIVRNLVYEKYPHIQHLQTCLKIYEDIVLYSKIQNWDQICKYFQTISQEERNYNIPEEKLKKWHQIFINHVKHKPNDQTIYETYASVGQDDRSEDFVKGVNQILNDHPSYIEEFYKIFDI